VEYTLQNRRVSGGEERADILVKKSFMQGIELTAKDIPSMIDELPLVALLCAFADGESRITGAQELRVKESDRIRATGEMIRNLGGDCEELPDGFIIRGRKKLRGGDIDSHLDHRIAMTGAVGLLASELGGNLHRPECCAVSFPEFFEKVELKGI
jgi:3-phosphoshikimate 1-carboxyvinyltransferase